MILGPGPPDDSGSYPFALRRLKHLSAKLVLGKALYEYVASGTDDEQSEHFVLCVGWDAPTGCSTTLQRRQY